MCECVHVRVLITTEGKRRSSDVTLDIIGESNENRSFFDI